MQLWSTNLGSLGQRPQDIFLKCKSAESCLIVYPKCTKKPVAQTWVVAKSEADFSKILQLWRNDSTYCRYTRPFACDAASLWSHHPAKFTFALCQCLFGPVRGCSLPARTDGTVLQRPGPARFPPSFDSVASIVDRRQRFFRASGRRTASST